MDIVYTDIAKGFDSVSHSTLISVLNSFGVSGKLLKWINAFLCNRNQKVCVNNSFSSTLEVYCGVPQGSVLGPLLFVVYIDDLVNAASLTSTTANGIYLFADDAKLFSGVPHELQTALDSINAWVNDRQLSLAPSKCEHLTIARKNKSPANNIFNLGLHNIKSVSVVKDLGIHVSDNLKWSCHVSHIYNVALMCAFQVLHSFSSRNIWTLLKAYTTYVRPKLDYNTVVWSPFLHKGINLVESVRKKFTHHVCIRCKISFNSYSDRLSKLNINSLEYRRLEFDLILMFKICHNLCDLNFYEFFKLHKSRYNLRQHSLTVESLFHPKHELYRYFFFNRIVKIWNNLPESIISAETLPIFKRRLHKFDLHNIANLTY